MSNDTKQPCGDCAAEPGKMHMPGCDVERCSQCGGQSISCDCIYEFLEKALNWTDGMPEKVYEEGPTEEMCELYDKHLETLGGRMPWTGTWPGAEDCRRLNLWSFWGPDYGKKGWQKCEKDHPGAREDLNALCYLEWDKEKRRFG